MRGEFTAISVLLLALTVGLAQVWPPTIYALVVLGPLLALGLHDILQKRHAIRRNFPVIGRMRYLLETIRPEIQQYFVESNTSGRPYSRLLRSVVYQRAKNVRDTVAFGTEHDLYEVGAEWMNHSLAALEASHEPPVVRVGGPDCKQPYDAAVMNIGAMSYGALSDRAIEALNAGAKRGGFAHNTGEGSISAFHERPGGDLIWQLGTGYFGCRHPDGTFNDEAFRERAAKPQVRMIEIKLSQGAKPGHGGILPAAKVTEEIARIRLVQLGHDVISPPTHSAFDSPEGLMRFVLRLRELSGGKPIGFKLCVGKRREFLAICKAMLTTGVLPDFITVDGAEGGTGAAPPEFTNVLGTPLTEALVFVHNALVGIDVRDRIRVIASGHVASGFDLAKRIGVGADLCYAARSMMFALGCIQAQKCNTNECPTGVATQRRGLIGGLHVGDKTERVYYYQRNTVHAFMELIAAAGLRDPAQLRPWHIFRRITSNRVQHYGEIYDFIEPASLLDEDNLPEAFARAWLAADPTTWEHADDDPHKVRHWPPRSMVPTAPSSPP